MRIIKVPQPYAVQQLSVVGPVLPIAASASAALRQLDRALAGLPRLDAEVGLDGWTVVRRSHVFHRPVSVETWLWCARPERAAELVARVAFDLEGAGFRAHRKPHPVTADAGFEPSVVYLRVGTVRLGLEPRTSDLLGDIEVVEEERDDIDLGLQYRFDAQRCPSCRVEDVPLALVAGFPGPELMLAAELGEVAFADGGLVDRRARNNARCRRCGADFVAR